MPAPEISAFGDGAHDAGTAGIDIDGGGFGAFPGSAWIYASSDRTGNSDQLTVNSWNDIQINVDIPGSLNNSDGTRYLFVQREDLAWSQGFEFTLGEVAADPVIISLTGVWQPTRALAIDATIRKGSDYTLEIAIPGDRSTYSVIAYRVGKRLTDTTVLEITGSANANGSVVTMGSYDGTNTTVSITFKRQDTEGLTAMRHVHELILSDGTNYQSVLTDSSDSDAYLTVLDTLPAV